MGRLLEAAANAASPLLWIEDSAYTARLLAGGNPPLLDAAAYVAFRRKAIGLLRSDIAAVPVGIIAAAWLGAHPALQSEMAGARNLAGGLRLLLADEGMKAHLAAIVHGLGAATGTLPVALVLPSPAEFLASCAPARVADLDEDAIDGAALYMTEFLRGFAAARVDAVLLDERSGATLAELLEPLANLAAHYRWDFGRRLSVPGAAGSGFVIAPGQSSGVAGVELAADFWSGAPPAPVAAGQFRFVEVPEGVTPETVLSRLTSLLG